MAKPEMTPDHRLSPDDLTPRGWLVASVLGTLVLALLVAGVGALTPGLPSPGAVPNESAAVSPTPEANSHSDEHGTGPATDGPSTTPDPTSTTAPKKATTAPQKPKSSAPPKVPEHGPGTYVRPVANLDNKEQRGRVIRYTVRVEHSVPVNADDAARTIHGILNDKRSWSGDGSVTWVYVPGDDVDLTAYITTPDTTDKLCRPLNTRGELSCRNEKVIALNALRWTGGVPHFKGDLTSYRQYLVNHEFGHFLGYGHVSCPGKGKRAPVMMTQTIGLEGCLKNPWPANDP